MVVSSSSRLPLSDPVAEVNPVTFPPGCAGLLNQTRCNGIRRNRHDNGNGLGYSLRFADHDRLCRENHIDLEAHEVGDQFQGRDPYLRRCRDIQIGYFFVRCSRALAAFLGVL